MCGHFPKLGQLLCMQKVPDPCHLQKVDFTQLAVLGMASD